MIDNQFYALLDNTPPWCSVLCFSFRLGISQSSPFSDIVVPLLLLLPPFPVSLYHSFRYLICMWATTISHNVAEVTQLRVIIFPSSLFTSSSLRMLALVLFSFQLTSNNLLHIHISAAIILFSSDLKRVQASVPYAWERESQLYS